MLVVPVFAAERDAGIAELVRSSNSIAYCSAAELSEKVELPESATSRLSFNGNGRAKAANNGSFDLHYLKTLLVSTTWNKNDDVFEPTETWLARATPVDKPFNYEHTCSDIIGHITSNYVIGDDGKRIDDNIVIDDVPSKFHIVTGAVLYKCWADDTLQERMDRILAEIAENKWYVSMECLFTGFDYAIKDSDGKCRVVARNEQTSFLTKYLRAYSGKGFYEGQQIGRVLRNITFSGKGLVRKPANPESIIFADDSKGFSVGRLIVDNNMHVTPNQVYSNHEATSSSTQIKGHNKNMPTEIELLQSKIDELTKQNKSLESSIAEQNVKGVQAQLDKTVSALSSKEEELKVAKAATEKLAADLAQAKTAITEVETKMAEETKNSKAIAEELNAIKEAQKKATRLSAVKAALNVDEKDAKTCAVAVDLLDSLSELSDEKFEKYVSSIAKFTPAPFPPNATPAKDPPKSTPAKDPKDATVPTAKGPAQEGQLNTVAEEKPEVDPADVNADPAVLAAAAAVKNASLNTSITDTGVNDVQRQIASFFGCEEVK